MLSVTGLTETAALVGEPARTAMLMALMDGRALTAGELARVAGLTAQTASGHLGKMTDAGLLARQQQGRHRYYRLASPAIAGMLEAMMVAVAPPPVRTGPRDAAMRRARICYDHLAGEVAVRIADTMIAHGQIELATDGALVTDSGRRLLEHIGIELPPHGPGKGAVFCRPCLDWSERRNHIAGLVGSALYRGFSAQHWIRRAEGSRIVLVTPRGRAALERHFGISD